MKNKISYSILLLACLLFVSCHGRPTNKNEEDTQETVTPVTVTQCTIGTMQEEIELNAVSVFLQKNVIKAPTNGYLKSANVLQGHKVRPGQVLFMLKGKEAEILGNVLNEVDSTSHFTGIVNVSVNKAGYITAINHQEGDYVQEGDPLAEISDINSLVFLMQMPYELSPYLSRNKTLNLELPDGKIIPGAVALTMPTVDLISQTQSVVIKVNNAGVSIPENLITKVKIVKNSKPNAVSVPKAAVLADETQDNFWIMKMMDGETAVKIPITKGIESAGRIEILSPKLSSSDIILETGNYGLPDTARVVIQK